MKILHGSRFTRGHPLHWKTFFSSKDGVRATASVALYSSTGKTTVHRHFFVVVQSLSRVQLFATPRTAAHQAPLSSTISQSLLRLTSIELVMLSNHLILCCSLLLLPSSFPGSIFSNELAFCIKWPKYWSFFSVLPSHPPDLFLRVCLSPLSLPRLLLELHFLLQLSFHHTQLHRILSDVWFNGI